MTALITPRSPRDRWSDIMAWSAGVPHQCDCAECLVLRRKHCPHPTQLCLVQDLLDSCTNLAHQVGVAPIVVILKIVFVWASACLTANSIHVSLSENSKTPIDICLVEKSEDSEHVVPHTHMGGPCITCHFGDTSHIINKDIARSLVSLSIQSDPENLARIVFILDNTLLHSSFGV